ncbi:MAG: EAL domain-containing protein [Magnetococcales bacterium]|nr:EAL domain-containing protein [Magnetococcales bacterium]
MLTKLSRFSRRLPITWKVTASVLAVSVVSWLLLDQYQTRRVEEIFRDHYLEELARQDRENRTRFHDVLSRSENAARLLAGHKKLLDAVQKLPAPSPSPALDAVPGDDDAPLPTPTAGTAKGAPLSRLPDWMPENSVLRSLGHLRHVVILDDKGRAKLHVSLGPTPLPALLKAMPPELLERLKNQALLTNVEGTPHLLALQPAAVSPGRKPFQVLVATPLDNLLLSSLGRPTADSYVALLDGRTNQAIATDAPDQLVLNAHLDQLRGQFLVAGQEFLDFGVTDIPLRFVTLVSQERFHKLSATILAEERRQRFSGYSLLVLVVVLTSYQIARNIQKFSREMVDFANANLGIQTPDMGRGDQLFLVEEQFRHMADEILLARERLQQEAEEKVSSVTRLFESALNEVDGQLRLTSQLYENAVEGMIIMDAAGIPLQVNPAFSTITGYLPEDVIGQNAPFLLFEEQEEEGGGLVRDIWQALHAKGVWRGEIWNRRKGGDAYPEMRTITAIEDREGRIVNIVAVFHDLTDLKRSEAELKFQTYHDALTGLPNRTLFLDRLRQVLGHADRTGEKVGVVIIDLDLFKNINDSLGHVLGDRVLQETGKRLQSALRDEDTASRMGGDEFACIVRQVRNVQDVVHVVRKLLSGVNAPLTLEGNQLFMAASAGITLYPEDGKDETALLRNADMAVNRAKQAGRNRFVFYAPAMAEQASHRLRLESDLRRALEQHQFLVYFQPKLALASDRVTGMEALVRWHHPDKGLIPPGEFIPLAEETGLIIPLGDWVLETACRTLKKWLDAGFGPMRVAVNLSARQFQNKDLPRRVAEILEITGLPVHQLELEITESMVMANVERSVAILKEIREMGIHISVDDFGTGYSSLSYLTRFPLHALKIDRSFIMGLPEDADNASLVPAIISMAQGMRLKVIAEGVETLEQQEFLKQHGCDEIQGYYLSRPLPEEAFTHFLESRLVGA